MDILPVISLCTGGGGLERGLELAGLPIRPILYVEREAFAAEYVASQIEAGRLADAPIWTNVETIPEEVLRRLRNLAGLGIVGGFPCQPWSAAGKRKKTEDDRWIWRDIERVFCGVRPEWCFLENVAGLLRGGIECVLGTLAKVGHNAEWGCYRADEAGAPHKRERLFIYGYKLGSERISNALCGGLWEEQRRRESRWARETKPRDVVEELAHTEYENDEGSGEQEVSVRGKSGQLANSACECVHGSGETRKTRRDEYTDSDEELANSDFSGGFGISEPEGIQGTPRSFTDGCSSLRKFNDFPPGPNDEWVDIPNYLWPALTKEAAAELEVCGLANGLDKQRIDLLRLLGNGVVPQQAALAFVDLHKRSQND